MSLFTGSGVALVTPFKADGSIDYDTLLSLVEFQIAMKTDAIIVAGTTGEASTMSDGEQLDCIRFVVDHVHHRIPVIAGCGSNDTRHGINLSIEAQKCGVDGLLEVTPYYNKTSQTGLYHHFKVIAEAVDIPILLYNVPGRTQVNLLPETVYQLSHISNVIGLKDATGNLAQTLETRRLCGEGFDLYSGNDDVVVPVLAAGGVGVISVLANICPNQTHNMVVAFLQGDVKRSLAIQVEMKTLIDALFMEPNPIPVKRSLELLGYPSMHLRLPLYESSEATTDHLRQCMRAVGLL